VKGGRAIRAWQATIDRPRLAEPFCGRLTRYGVPKSFLSLALFDADNLLALPTFPAAPPARRSAGRFSPPLPTAGPAAPGTASRKRPIRQPAAPAWPGPAAELGRLLTGSWRLVPTRRMSPLPRAQHLAEGQVRKRGWGAWHLRPGAAKPGWIAALRVPQNPKAHTSGAVRVNPASGFERPAPVIRGAPRQSARPRPIDPVRPQSGGRTPAGRTSALLPQPPRFALAAQASRRPFLRCRPEIPPP
jgi:hypothetical protein